YARSLRRSQTDAEQKMWSLLRDRRLAGFKFRRQRPIGPCIVDFCCVEPRLVIELDGGHHASSRSADAARNRILEGQGYRVLRFWNNEVLGNTSGVLQRIVEALAAPHPTLSPPGRGKEVAAPHPTLSPPGRGKEVAAPHPTLSPPGRGKEVAAPHPTLSPPGRGKEVAAPHPTLSPPGRGKEVTAPHPTLSPPGRGKEVAAPSPCPLPGGERGSS